jgi:hypothetical protein
MATLMSTAKNTASFERDGEGVRPRQQRVMCNNSNNILRICQQQQICVTPAN